MSGPIGASSWMYGIEPAFYDYEINQSLRFNDPDSPYLYRTPSSQSNLTTFTYSFWYKRCKFGTYQEVLHVYPGSGERSQILFMNDDTLKVELEAANVNHFRTNKLFRDPSAWYHVVVAFDSTNASSTNRVKIYVNGVDEADTANGGSGFSTANYPSQNATSGFNTTTQHEISTYDGSDYHLDGYLAEVNFIDGTALTASSFGETKEGIWIPKEYSGSYGTNGFYLPFDNTSAIGEDKSPNTNNFTVVNLSGANDIVFDSPTNNFATFNPLNSPAAVVLLEGNLKFTQTSNDRAAIGNMAISSGKWYYEVYYTAGSNPEAGLARIQDSFANSGATGATDKFLYITNGTSFRTPAWTTTDATGVSAQTSETILGFAVDADNGKTFISVNNTYINSGNPAAGSNPQATFDADWVTQTGGGIIPFIGMYTGTSGDVRINFGQDSSFGGAKTVQGNQDEEGIGDFFYAPPSGFLALCSKNLSKPDIIDGKGYFNTVLYTGNGGTSQSITGVGFQPDFLWTKSRSSSDNHHVFDSVRGASTARLFPNLTNAEDGNFGSINSFDSDGFTTGNNTGTNQNSTTYAAWNWKAGGTASTNTDGSVDSEVSVNTDAGFSIATFTNVATGGDRSFGHGLGKTPTMVIVKKRASANDFWFVWHKNLSTATDNYLRLNENASEYTVSSDNGLWGGGITSSVVGMRGTSFSTGTSDTFVAYSFTDIEGYSKAGKYVGNGNADGTFVYTGFRPAWIMQKKINNTGHWHMWDSTRNTSNEVSRYLLANETNSEYTDGGLDILSNGFKPRKTGTGLNASGDTYIYLAFADQPFKYANAR